MPVSPDIYEEEEEEEVKALFRSSSGEARVKFKSRAYTRAKANSVETKARFKILAKDIRLSKLEVRV